MSKRDRLGKGLKNLQTVRSSSQIEPTTKAEAIGDPAKKKSNAGRPNEGKGKRKPAVFRLEPESIELLTRHAAKVGRSKSDIINELIMKLGRAEKD